MQEVLLFKDLKIILLQSGTSSTATYDEQWQRTMAYRLSLFPKWHYPVAIASVLI